MKIHNVKCHSKYFHSHWAEHRLFTIRRDDRHYQLGDKIRIQEFDPDQPRYLSKSILFDVKEKWPDAPGLQPGFCILILTEVSRNPVTHAPPYCPHGHGDNFHECETCWEDIA